MTKPILGITMFESLLFRSYFADDSNRIISKLVLDFQLVFFTNSDNYPLIAEKLKLFEEYSPKIVIYSYKKEAFIARLVTFFLRWSIRSGTLFVKIQQKRIYWRVLAFIPYYFVSSSRLVKTFLRFFLKYIFNIASISNQFDPIPIDLDYLFVTSLTNNYEDARVAIFYQKKKVKIIGSVRSWDNLTSHGSLYLEPDLFLAQSDWQSHCARAYHFIPSDKIVEVGNPAYDNKYLKIENSVGLSSFSQEVFVTFASMGDEINPDDSNFCAWLINKWGEMPPNFKLSILCHPKFKSDVKFNDSRIQQICFDFSSSKIEDYYTFLKNQSIVICGGTSVLLDCAFTNTAVIILNFDVIKQDYWESAQRYFDFMDHTKTLISRFDYKVARTENEIISVIKKQINGIEPIQSAYYFLGTNYQSFHNLDFKLVVSFLSDKTNGK